MSRKRRNIIIWTITAILVIGTVAVSVVIDPTLLGDWIRLVRLIVAAALGVTGVVQFINQFALPASDKPVERMTPEQRHDTREHLKTGLAFQHKNLLDRFLDAYLGKDAEEPVPFGGRDAPLATLTQWLDAPSSKPYLLLTAPAGRGKTHLLAQWAARCITRQGAERSYPLRVIFAPVSIRFGTAQPETHLQMLARGLAQFYHDPIQETAHDTRATWREICAEYLAKPHKNGDRLLVIVDGLDESTDADQDSWRALTGDLPAGTLVLFSARCADDKDANTWRERLGLDEDRAARLDLPPLDRNGLHQALESMGNPLKGYAQEGGILDALLRLTQGDPLLVRLYVEDLRDHLQPGQNRGRPVDAQNVLERLKATEPDLKGYFERWWEEQRKQWKAQEKAPGEIENRLRGFFRLLAAAFSPLNGAEISALGDEHLRFEHQQKELVEWAPRIVIGSAQDGYTFSHPRFGQYFYEEAMDAGERAEVERLFLEAGERALADLRAGKAPKDVPAYFVLHSKDHLLRAIEAGRARPPALYALICEPWLRAREYHGETPASFLEDVEAAWEAASQQPDGDPGMQILALLCFSSVATLSSNIPVEIIAGARGAGVLNRAQALAYLRQNTNLAARAEGLALLSEREKDAPEQAVLFQEALDAARAIEHPRFRSRALAEIAPRLSADRQAGVQQEALDAARAIEDSFFRDMALAEVASRLPADGQASALQEALDAARSIEYPNYRARALAEIAPRLPTDRQVGVLQEALDAARSIEDPYYRARALAEIAPRLPTDRRAGVLQEALDAARTIENSNARLSALAEIAPHLPPEQALDTARAIEDSYYRAMALAAVALRLPTDRQADVLQEALDLARAIEDTASRARALAEIAPLLPTDRQVGVLQEALDAARAIEDTASRAMALAEIAPLLPTDRQAGVLQEALDLARAIEDTDARARTLAEIAPHLPPEQALDSARAIDDTASRARTLAEIASLLPADRQPGVIQEALNAARAIEDSDSRARALAAIAPLLPTDRQVGVLQEALDAARAIEDTSYRARTLAEIAPHLPPKQALNAARAIEDTEARASALAEIALHLPADRQADVLQEAIDTARAIEDSFHRARALAAFAPRLPADRQPGVLQEALDASRTIENSNTRVSALAEIAPSLPANLQPGVLQEALDAARAIEHPRDRALALAVVAPCLPADRQAGVLQEALNTACAIEHFRDRSSLLAEIFAPRLPSEQALEAARTIEHPIYRSLALAEIALRAPASSLPEIWQFALRTGSADVLEALAERWPELCAALRQAQPAALTATLRAFQQGKRGNVLKIITAMLPVIEQLGGQVAVEQTVRAIRDVSEWWP